MSIQAPTVKKKFLVCILCATMCIICDVPSHSNAHLTIDSFHLQLCTACRSWRFLISVFVDLLPSLCFTVESLIAAHSLWVLNWTDHIFHWPFCSNLNLASWWFSPGMTAMPNSLSKKILAPLAGNVVLISKTKIIK